MKDPNVINEVENFISLVKQINKSLALLHMQDVSPMLEVKSDSQNGYLKSLEVRQIVQSVEYLEEKHDGNRNS